RSSSGASLPSPECINCVIEARMAHAIHAARGSALSCRGWVQEAALRMLQNNLDPEVAEKPEELVVYGGSGKAARDWPSFERICASLRGLGDEETLLVQSGKPVGVLRTHPDAPRVLIANSNLVPKWVRRGRSAGSSRDTWTCSRPRWTRRCARRSGRWNAAKGGPSEWSATRRRCYRSWCGVESSRTWSPTRPRRTIH